MPPVASGLFGPVKPPMVRELVVAASIRSGIPSFAILGKDRDPSLCRIRYGIWKQANESGRSLGQIGRVFNRHHSTILDGIRSGRRSTLFHISTDYLTSRWAHRFIHSKYSLFYPPKSEAEADLPVADNSCAGA